MSNRPALDYTINGQYSICLDEFVGADEWNSFFPEMCLGVATTKSFHEPLEIGVQTSVYDEDHIEPWSFIKSRFQHSEAYKTMVGKLSREEMHDYVKFRFQVKSLGTKLLLRTYQDYTGAFDVKHLESRNRNTEAMSRFPCVERWLDKQTVFKEVGRIVLFINERQNGSPIHTDYADMKTRKDQFIWINFRQKKRFFVLDGQGNKHYLDGTINTFDNANWHGSDPIDYACFTLRIDGLFTDNFLDATGLRTHYADVTG